jgi:soluble lytic murein transglycosylase-like protein
MMSVGVARADCIDDAGRYHDVNPTLLHVIAEHESGMRANAVNHNADGSQDLGLMQINSSWLPKLAKFGITRADLFNACVSAYVGAWILAANFKKYGQTWDAVGAYNATSPVKRQRYATAIYKTWVDLGPLGTYKK